MTGLIICSTLIFAQELKPIPAEDIRSATGTAEFVRDVPVNLIYVADFSKMGDLTEADKVFYSAADTGFISENVYLYCASEGLATVVRRLIQVRAAYHKFLLIILETSLGLT